MLIFLQMDPTKSVGAFFGRSTAREPLTFKIERKWRNPWEEEVPVQAMAALEISKKCRTMCHLPHDLPTWGHIKTLTNQAENLVSQQGMPLNPENIFVAMLSLLAFASPLLRLTWLITLISLIYLTPLLLQVIIWTDIRPIISTNDSVHMPPP